MNQERIERELELIAALCADSGTLLHSEAQTAPLVEVKREKRKLRKEDEDVATGKKFPKLD